MGDELQIRTVTLELLRPGPPHNQLLSPLTQYLAICGDSGAGVVTLPYEHASFERRLKDLRYETGDREDRLAMLRDTGADVAKILAGVPGLPGALAADPARQGTMIHLRIILSASELALLPFELAKIPAAQGATSEAWLAVQTRPPVCVTRHIRTVSSEGVEWPLRPRILFVSGDPADIPFDAHREALLEAIRPFRYPARDDRRESAAGRREDFGEWLTILKDATLDEVVTACRSDRYTHVHVLAHGALDESTHGRSFGLLLRGRDGETEVVGGDRFASAVASVGTREIHRPAVVTVASCDSANVGSVVVPGASFAHALHQSGIPLVVASQFPLSKEGSITVTATLYQGLMWGTNPWVLLHQVRSELHSRHGAGSHDWASLVVYEALPANTADQFETLRYKQARASIDAALEGVDAAVREEGAALEPARCDELMAAVHRAAERLPSQGHYAMEGLGLRASSLKRLAHARFLLVKPGDDSARAHLDESCSLLDRGLERYRQAVRGFLVNEGQPPQREATLHWVLVQQLSLSAVLGKSVEEGTWEIAKLAAEAYLDHPSLEERAWAQANLAELWLLRLADPSPKPRQRARASANAKDRARELARLYPWEDAFPVKSTRSQFRRYVSWWGDEAFASGLDRRARARRGNWGSATGLVRTAAELVQILEAGRRSGVAHDAASSQPVHGPKVSPRRETAPPPPAASAPPPGGPLLRRAATAAARAREGAFFDIEMLPAQHGDCLWLEYGEGESTSRVLVDCGTRSTHARLAARVEQVPAAERSLELLVMTHIDADHIGGAIPFLKGRMAGLKVQDIWFNGWRHISGNLGAKQGEIFSTLIQDQRLPWNLWREGSAIVVEDDLPTHELPGGLRLTLFSPTPSRLTSLQKVWKKELEREGLTPGKRAEYRAFLRAPRPTSTDVDELAEAAFTSDDGPPNGSSIALLAEFSGKSILLGADAHSPVLADSIRKLLGQRGEPRLKLHAFKVSHHGSKNNVSRELLELLDCRHYLFSSNGDHFNHPDREAVARIVKHGGPRPVLHFNYRSTENAFWDDAARGERYGYEAVYPAPGVDGLVVPLR